MSSTLLANAATLLVALPLLGALLLWTFPRNEDSGALPVALLVALAELGLALWTWSAFPQGATLPQFATTWAWIPSLGVHYAVGIDGIAMTLVLLTCLLVPLVLAASEFVPAAHELLAASSDASCDASCDVDRAPPHSVTGVVCRGSRNFAALVLLLQGAMVGAFVAQDLLLFYCFWEGMLVPAYFLVGIFGGDRRVHATLQFFLYTMAGSMLLLVAMVGAASVGHAGGPPSFLYADVVLKLHGADLGAWEVLLFAGFAVAFLIKVPLLPLHAWLSETYVQAPATVTVLLSGVMVKVGAYGLLRYALLLFPRAATLAMPLLIFLATASCLWAAWLAYGQPSLRRIVAYSSISHMALVVLGLLAVTPSSVAGSALQMFNHGITSGGLFLWVSMVERRRKSSQLSDLGGMAHEAPAMAISFVVLALASMGLPGLNGFVGEFLILLGSFSSQGLGLSTPEGAFAQAAMILLMAGCGFVAVYVTWLLYGLEGLVWRSPLGRSLRVLGAGLAGTLAWALVMVPTESFAGGLLVRPFVNRTLSGLPFTAPLPLAACACTLSVVMAAAYLLRGAERALLGPVHVGRGGPLVDLTGRERLVLAPLLALTLFLGLHPQPLLATAEPTVVMVVEQFRNGAGWPPAATRPTQPVTPARGTQSSPMDCPFLSQPPSHEEPAHDAGL